MKFKSGIGITKIDLLNLFEAFHRAQNIGNIRDSGLGLSIVHRYIQLHHGKITIESEVGIDTGITVNLPRYN